VRLTRPNRSSIKELSGNENLVSKAYSIAQSELRRCYSNDSIYAGLNQFADTWARDSLFASFGALAIGDTEIVRKNLSLLAKNQHPNGQIPLRIGDYFVALKVLRINTTQTPRPRYDQDKYISYPTDQNSLFVLAAKEYLSKTSDKKFISSIYSNLEKVIAWNLGEDKDQDNLMEEGHYATWADSVTKGGKVHYTNVLHCAALGAMADISSSLGRRDESRRYKDLSGKVKKRINEVFWNGRYYSDWIDSKKHDFFSTDGNVLSILYDIADRKQAISIEKCIDEFGINYPVPSKTNYPKYPFNVVSIYDHLAMIPDYHNGMSWLWLGCIDAAAKWKIGQKKESLKLIQKISDTIVANNGVFEVYEQTGKPVRRIIYHSERPFAWSSGLFLYAVSQIKPELLKTRH
jgi:glycogen debranching enzyme